MDEPEREPSDLRKKFDDAAAKDNSCDRIRSLARIKASERHDTVIGFRHLLQALVEDNPALVDAVLSPKLNATTVLRALATERGAPAQATPGHGAGIAPDSLAAGAINVATAATAAHYRSDWFFGLELLHAMLAANAGAQKSERSVTLTYIEIVLSDDSTDAAANVRKRIDRLAYSLDEKLPPKLPPASAVTWDPEL